VINAYSDGGHRVQVMTDLFTVEERLGPGAGKTLAFIGRLRLQNMACSLSRQRRSSNSS